MKKCLFIDRDGTINKYKGYCYKVSEVELIDGADRLIKAFNDRGYLVIIISNQAGVSLGLYTENDVRAVENYIKEQLKPSGAHLDGAYYCFHKPFVELKDGEKACDCRKPLPGMIEHAIKDFDIDRTKSLFLGDNITDYQCADAAFVAHLPYDDSISIDMPNNRKRMVFTYDDEFISKILAFAESL